MFEVGKKYKYCNSVYTCMYVGDKYSVLSAPGHEAIPYNYMANGHHGWTEYKEPVVEKYTRHVGRYRDGKVGTWVDKNSIVASSEFMHVECIGSYEFTITDGKLTDIRILE